MDTGHPSTTRRSSSRPPPRSRISAGSLSVSTRRICCVGGDIAHEREVGRALDQGHAFGDVGDQEGRVAHVVRMELE